MAVGQTAKLATRLLLGVVIVVVLFLLLVPATTVSRESSRRRACLNNLKQVALALHYYDGQYGSFPPAYVVGPDGRRWHSWRVLILPFLEQQSLYDQYHFDEPWNGPNNSKLAAEMPGTYACPSTTDQANVCASYFAVVGPATVWPGAKPRSLDEITDDPANTILLVEAGGLGVCWMEPRDLEFDVVARLTEPDPKVVGSVGHPRRMPRFSTAEGPAIHVAAVDGSVHDIPRVVVGKPLVPLLTMAGGEDAVLEAVSAIGERLDWPRILLHAAVALVPLLLLGAACWWLKRLVSSSDE